MKVKVELEFEFEEEYNMKDVEEYLEYHLGNLRSILTKNSLYKDEVELYATHFNCKEV